MKRVEHYRYGKASKRVIPTEFSVFRLVGTPTTYIIVEIKRGGEIYLKKLENNKITKVGLRFYNLRDFFYSLSPIQNHVTFYK